MTNSQNAQVRQERRIQNNSGLVMMGEELQETEHEDPGLAWLANPIIIFPFAVGTGVLAGGYYLYKRYSD